MSITQSLGEKIVLQMALRFIEYPGAVDSSCCGYISSYMWSSIFQTRRRVGGCYLKIFIYTRTIPR